MELRLKVGDEDGAMVGGPEVVGGGEGVAEVLFDDLVVAVVIEPDAIEPGGVLKIAHGGEGDPDGSVDIVFAFDHFGAQDADDGEHDAVETDALADGIAAGEELGFGIGADDADVGALLLFEAVEEPAFVDFESEDVEAFGAYAVYLPTVGMKVVLDGCVLEHDGCNGGYARDGVPDQIHVIKGEADFDAGFVRAGLLGGSAAIDLDVVDAPLGEDVDDGAGEACAVGEQEHDGGDAPGHADHGDHGTAAVVEHGFPGLGENVDNHEGLRPGE